MQGVATPAERATWRLRVTGQVQGVGYRPFVYREATRLALDGWVRNDASGVDVEVSGQLAALEMLAARLREAGPPAARVQDVRVTERRNAVGASSGFQIVASDPSVEVQALTLIPPDLALCPECRAELLDPKNRRFRYPFINCTNCGPRFSIMAGLPYDRPLTTMRGFELCPKCRAEYDDPLDRRFHAQPVACATCGPGVAFLVGAPPVQTTHGNAAILAAAEALRTGKIVAVKGLGGYHLACDARNLEAVSALRERKARRHKPFAVMAATLAAAADLVELNEATAALLESIERPIVLAAKRAGALSAELLEALAPGNADLGVMLPYTPLQELLFASDAPTLLVMTSANRASEPILYRDGDALVHLSGLVDAWLTGERPIERRVDDSVAVIRRGAPALLRRARGYAPRPVAQGDWWAGPPIIALGGDLKAAITVVAHGRATVSQHLGDLSTVEAWAAYQDSLRDLSVMLRVDAGRALLVHDLHPDYRSSTWARSQANVKLGVGHHRAHVASVLAEHEAYGERVVGLAADGVGFAEPPLSGEDKAENQQPIVWGCEAFAGSLDLGLRHVARLRPFPLPGGDAAARNPRQMLAGLACALGGSALEGLVGDGLVDARLAETVRVMVKRGLNTPWCDSLGRVFDAAAAACGFDGENSFEGRAAIWLEALARTGEPDGAYPLPFAGGEWDWQPLLTALLKDRERGVAPGVMAGRVHAGLADGLAIGLADLARAAGAATIAISGGVMANRVLTDRLHARLRAAGLRVLENREVPCGDGGLSLGQAALAVAARRRGKLGGQLCA